MTPIVTESIEAYARSHTEPPSPLLQELTRETYEKMPAAQMQVGPLEGAFLRLLVRLTGAKRILEIGMFTGYSGLWMLDALQDAGYADLKHKTITVLSDPSPQVDAKLAADLVDVYEQRTRAVYRVPYDPALVAGSVVPYAQLSKATRLSWLRACAGMAEAL